MFMQQKGNRCLFAHNKVPPAPSKIPVQKGFPQLVSLWGKSTGGWVKVTPIDYLPRISVKCTGVLGKITPMKQAIFTQLQKCLCYSPKSYPISSKIYTDISAISESLYKKFFKVFTKKSNVSEHSALVKSFPSPRKLSMLTTIILVFKEHFFL